MKIALLGDMALIGRYDRTVDDNVNERVLAIKELLNGCDFVVANQESVLSDKKHTVTCKGVYLRSNPVNVETLKFLGVTHVTLANNHIYDYGKTGALDTVKALSENNIFTVGLSTGPALLKKGDDRAMLDGFCCLSANAVGYGNKRGDVHLLNNEEVESFVAYAEKNNCLPIVSAHFGIEGVHYPSQEHLNLFRNLAENHDYVLHGNHPHAIQGYEKHKNSLLAYALGDFCFDDCTITSINRVAKQTEKSRNSYIVILNISGNKFVDYDIKCITDMPNGYLHECPEMRFELDKYSKDLCLSLLEIEKLQKKELNNQIEKRQIRDIKFYLDRMNWKYLGAYVNGKIHSKAYKKELAPYIKLHFNNLKEKKGHVSVLMAVYNCENTIEQAIDSVLEQTYTDWKMIICNDCSTDGTVGIIENKYIRKYPDKFLLIHNEKNMKLAASLNHCLQYADGEFSVRMDGDDYISSDKFEKQVKYLQDNPDVQLVGTNMQVFNDDGLGREVQYKPNPNKYDLRYGPCFAHATIMMRTKTYKDIGGYTVSPRTVRSQDYDLWFKFFSKGYEGRNILEPLYFVREDENAFLRRKPKLYLWATVTRYKGFRKLHYPLKYYWRVATPIVSLFGNELRKIKAKIRNKSR